MICYRCKQWPCGCPDGQTIINGDCRQVLADLPAESVQTCVTSPPYWGLRDYGTATWEGGDGDHEHDTTAARGGRGGSGTNAKEKAYPAEFAVDVCSCGARRIDSQVGLESTPAAYVAEMVAIFRAVRRVLRKDGTVWLNLGDSYFGAAGGYDAKYEPDDDDPHSFGGTKNAPIRTNQRQKRATPPKHETLKTKDLCGIPWRVAFALQADGWWLRQDIIWSKPNPMPESIRDRCTKAHEYIFLLAKSERYHYATTAIAEPFADDRLGNPGGYSWGYAASVGATGKRNDAGRMAEGWNTDGVKSGRNRRSVWTVTTRSYKGAHFATFPPKLIEPCILAGCPEGGTVIDPFNGSGTTGDVCRKLGRKSIGIELNAGYCDLAADRLGQGVLF